MQEKNYYENLYEEYSERFKEMSDCELVEAFNREVGNPGWTGARGCYLAALHEEFCRRGFVVCNCKSARSLSLKKKVRLEYKPVLVPVE